MKTFLLGIALGVALLAAPRPRVPVSWTQAFYDEAVIG